MPYYDEFKHRFRVESDKIETDPHLVETDKQAFRDHMNAWNGVDDMKEHANSFCHTAQLKGPVVDRSAAEVLGHGHDKKEFLALITERYNMSKDAAEALLRHWRSLDATQQIAEVRNRIGELEMARYLMWSFRDPAGADDPFAATALSDLACRLGFEEHPGKSYVYWGVSIPPDVATHRPTAFDADMLHLARWHAGGKTIPNAACRARYAYGLPEVVHRPATFAALTAAIR